MLIFSGHSAQECYKVSQLVGRPREGADSVHHRDHVFRLAEGVSSSRTVCCSICLSVIPFSLSLSPHFYLSLFLTYKHTHTRCSYLRKNPMIRWNAVKRWCRQILQGLEFLHTQHVIHRDIKCDNIFINGATGDLRIGDLGLSTKISEHGLAASLDRPITAVAMTCLGTPGEG